jgi:hypothetical protein
MPKIDGVWYDEEEMQEQLIALAGGRSKAEEMQRIWNRSYPGYGSGTFSPRKTKEDVFREKAKGAGFSDQAIELFIIC